MREVKDPALLEVMKMYQPVWKLPIKTEVFVNFFSLILLQLLRLQHLISLVGVKCFIYVRVTDKVHLFTVNWLCLIWLSKYPSVLNNKYPKLF